MLSSPVHCPLAAFIRGWDMTLVLLSMLPLLAGAGYGITVIIGRYTAKMNKAYAGESEALRV